MSAAQSNKIKLIDVKHKAHGIWDTIFPRFAIEMPRRNVHSPCPACGGEDRFRYDDQKGNGDYYCNVCGAGDGLSLIEKCTGMKLSAVITEVAAIVGLSDTSQITDKDRAQWKKEAELREKDRLAKIAKIQENIAAVSKKQWEEKHGDHVSAYLQRKQVDNFGCKVKANGDLLVPAMDEHGKIWNIQTIPSHGKKYFNPEEGGRVKGCFYLIGTIQLVPADQIICLAEGYATAASIHMATGYPVVVAFNSFNLIPVGAAIRRMYPSAKLVYCADDDSAKTNAGIDCANKALAATGGIAVLPKFNTSEGI